MTHTQQLNKNLKTYSQVFKLNNKLMLNPSLLEKEIDKIIAEASEKGYNEVEIVLTSKENKDFYIDKTLTVGRNVSLKSSVINGRFLRKTKLNTIYLTFSNISLKEVNVVFNSVCLKCYLLNSAVENFNVINPSPVVYTGNPKEQVFLEINAEPGSSVDFINLSEAYNIDSFNLLLNEKYDIALPETVGSVLNKSPAKIEFTGYIPVIKEETVFIQEKKEITLKNVKGGFFSIPGTADKIELIECEDISISGIGEHNDPYCRKMLIKNSNISDFYFYDIEELKIDNSAVKNYEGINVYELTGILPDKKKHSFFFQFVSDLKEAEKLNVYCNVIDIPEALDFTKCKNVNLFFSKKRKDKAVETLTVLNSKNSSFTFNALNSVKNITFTDSRIKALDLYSTDSLLENIKTEKNVIKTEKMNIVLPDTHRLNVLNVEPLSGETLRITAYNPVKINIPENLRVDEFVINNIILPTDKIMNLEEVSSFKVIKSSFKDMKVTAADKFANIFIAENMFSKIDLTLRDDYTVLKLKENGTNKGKICLKVPDIIQTKEMFLTLSDKTYSDKILKTAAFDSADVNIISVPKFKMFITADKMTINIRDRYPGCFVISNKKPKKDMLERINYISFPDIRKIYKNLISNEKKDPKFLIKGILAQGPLKFLAKEFEEKYPSIKNKELFLLQLKEKTQTEFYNGNEIFNIIIETHKILEEEKKLIQINKKKKERIIE